MFGSSLNYAAARLLGLNRDSEEAIKAREFLKPRKGALAGKYYAEVHRSASNKPFLSPSMGQALVGSIGLLRLGRGQSCTSRTLVAPILDTTPPRKVLVSL